MHSSTVRCVLAIKCPKHKPGCRRPLARRTGSQAAKVRPVPRRVAASVAGGAAAPPRPHTPLQAAVGGRLRLSRSTPHAVPPPAGTGAGGAPRVVAVTRPGTAGAPRRGAATLPVGAGATLPLCLQTRVKGAAGDARAAIPPHGKQPVVLAPRPGPAAPPRGAPPERRRLPIAADGRGVPRTAHKGGAPPAPHPAATTRPPPRGADATAPRARAAVLVAGAVVEAVAAVRGARKPPPVAAPPARVPLAARAAEVPAGVGPPDAGVEGPARAAVPPKARVVPKRPRPGAPPTLPPPRDVAVGVSARAPAPGVATRQAVTPVAARTRQVAVSAAHAAACGTPRVGATPAPPEGLVVAPSPETTRDAGPRRAPDAAAEVGARRVQAQTSDEETEQLQLKGVCAPTVADVAPPLPSLTAATVGGQPPPLRRAGAAPLVPLLPAVDYLEG